MKKVLLASFFILSLVFIPFAFASAAPDIGLGPNGLATDIADKAGYDKGTSETALSETVGKIIKAVLSLSGIIFLALTVYAGILWMTARGDSEQIGTAKNIITAAVIGLAITLSAYAITVFVVDKLTQSTTGATVGGTESTSPNNGASNNGNTLRECGTTQLPNTACVPPMMVESATDIEENGVCPGDLVCIK